MLEILNRIRYIIEDLVKSEDVVNNFCIGDSILDSKNNIYEYFLKMVIGEDKYISGFFRNNEFEVIEYNIKNIEHKHQMNTSIFSKELELKNSITDFSKKKTDEIKFKGYKIIRINKN